MNSTLGLSNELYTEMNMSRYFYEDFRHLCTEEEKKIGDRLEEISHLKSTISINVKEISTLEKRIKTLQVDLDVYQTEIKYVKSLWYNRLYLFFSTLRFRNPFYRKGA